MNRSRPCMLPVYIHMGLSNSLPERWSEQRRRYPYLPWPEEAIVELNQHSQQEGVPAVIVEDSKRSKALWLYGSEYYLGLYQTPKGGGYTLAFINPLDLTGHEELAKGMLILHGPRYILHPQIQQIPDGTNYWDRLWAEWNALQAQKRRDKAAKGQQQEKLTPEHENFLSAIEKLIETTYKIEQEKYKLSKPFPYIRVESAGEQRNALHDIYVFWLATPPLALNEKYMVRIKGERDLRGRISSVSGRRLTITFETLIDRQRIPAPGNIEVIYSSAIIAAQRQAIRMLREGEAKSKYLLRALVDRYYEPTKARQHPRVTLNAEQHAAFEHALADPDLCLVLGPPGTGKTYTITEIVRHHCSIDKKRVLITAGTHKAVDNVLQQLASTSLEVVRVGHVDMVAKEIHALLIDVKAKEKQATILKETERDAQMLVHFIQDKAQILEWLNQLASIANNLSNTEWQLQTTLSQQEYITQQITAPYRKKLEALRTSLRQQEQELHLYQRNLLRWQEAQSRADTKRLMFLLGYFFSWQWNYYEKRMTAASEHIGELQSVHEATQQEHKQATDALQRALWADSTYRMSEDAKHKLTQGHTVLCGKAKKVVGSLTGMAERLVEVPQMATLNAQELQHFLHWYQATYPLLECRAYLSQDWRETVMRRTEQLRPELLRYADVVGATCIGIATVSGLEDIDFDLAIVDEAGQICLPDLLVPLVRARRAALVGDHQQLPPFVDNEVQDWLNGILLQNQEAANPTGEALDGTTVANLLTKSTFELLFQDAANNHRFVRLIRQFRMPQVIADFVSLHFYNGQLHTEGADKAAHVVASDPLFQRSLIWIDTSTVANSERWETYQGSTETWGVFGYLNRVEANLIARIVAIYEQEDMEWIVIVPYRAQAQYIIKLLQQQSVFAATDLEKHVSTVDSFQGGERDKVIFGFTRSNQQHMIGFLSELRRLNVAMTRAREQLVLIGDCSTLVNATNVSFRTLAQALYNHVRRCGEMLTYQQCLNRLTTLEKKDQDGSS